MDAKELYARALNQASQAINNVKPEYFDKPTPDTEWDVRTLAGHMLYELSWTADIVRGATITQVGDRYDGDLIGNDLISAWRVAGEEARQAIEACDLKGIAHLSYGDVKIAEYLREAAGDQLIHGWDLSMAIGLPVHFDPEVAEEVYKNSLPKTESRSHSGLFAPPLEVPADADIQTKLLALYGRDNNWRKR